MKPLLNYLICSFTSLTIHQGQKAAANKAAGYYQLNYHKATLATISYQETKRTRDESKDEGSGRNWGMEMQEDITTTIQNRLGCKRRKSKSTEKHKLIKREFTKTLTKRLGMAG